MNSDILKHYCQFSMFTYPGLYKDKLIDLPNDIKEIGHLVRKQIIHRVTLANGNTKSNSDLRYGDMTKVPWWKQPEDDNLPTTSAMLAELYRRDDQGFISNRAEENKLILTCRFTAILMASILKAKNIPARVRSGFASYVSPKPGTNWDHWITQYWDSAKNRWITIDVDCCLESLNFDPFDMPPNEFNWSAETWLNTREGKIDQNIFWNAGGGGQFKGFMPIGWELYYDFHCLMNNEIIYLHNPKHVYLNEFEGLNEAELSKIDELAQLMLQPDENFYALKEIWESNKDIRLLTGGLL